MQSLFLITKPSKDYELIDSGNGEKLERFGSVVTARPDPQVLWEKAHGVKWNEATVRFREEWTGKKNVPVDWQVSFSGITFHLKLSAFKHVGIFPEQEENWDWIESEIQRLSKPLHVLNLFGYTGGATLFALKAGASVTHVDGSKTALSWARENAEASGLGAKPVRWILDDALAFVKREIRRGNRYDAIVLDPPSFGRGPEGEVWKIETHLPLLLSMLPELLSEKPVFVLLNGYASGYSPLAYTNSILPLKEKFGGTVFSGELGIEESLSRRILPAGIWARWSQSS